MSELRVMTWNVENLFEPEDADGPGARTEFEAKIESLAAVIDQAKPHVVALQEIGSESALTRLSSQLTQTMPHQLVGVPDGRGIAVAFLSQRVLGDRVDIAQFPAGMLPVQSGDDPPGPAGPATMNGLSRDALQVTIRAGGRDVHVISCHLKSKLLTFPGGRFSPDDEDQRARFAAYALHRRTAEATTLRTHLNGLLAGTGRETAVVLAGDLNDEVDAATTQIFNGPPGSEIGTDGFGLPDGGDGDRMWNLAPKIPAKERFSRRYRGRNELIDHIFVSHHLGTRTKSVRTLIAQTHLPSITDDPGEQRGSPGSDHSAVVATFELD